MMKHVMKIPKLHEAMMKTVEATQENMMKKDPEPVTQIVKATHESVMKRDPEPGMKCWTNWS